MIRAVPVDFWGSAHPITSDFALPFRREAPHFNVQKQGMRQLLLCTLTLCAGCLWAQDSYHTGLQSSLQTSFALPLVQQWALPNTETATLATVQNYGGTTTALTVTGQPFTQAQSRVVPQGNNPWDAGHGYPNSMGIAAGDKCLIVMYLRSTTPSSRVNIFAENNTTYTKEVFSEVVISNNWQRFLIPFQSSAAYGAGGLKIGLHLAYLSQTIEVGGVACLNYKNTVNLSQLPIELNVPPYDGYALDAPWRAEAAASIDQLRRANLQVTVQDASGAVYDGANIRFEMLQHEFKFGSAVVSNLFNSGSNFNATYQEKLTNLDGQGHGFNEVVFENDLKWPGWEQSWFSSKPELVSDFAWLANRDITVRGHNLMWPSWQYSPPDINASVTPAYLKNRARNHIRDILNYPGVGLNCIDWDVLNEVTSNTEYAAKLAGTPGYVTGREWYAEVFRQADSLAPNATLYLNDFVAIENADNPTNTIQVWRSRIDELVAANAPLEGIGFQGHFSASPTGIPRVRQVYDDFWNAYGLEAKVTEYDINILAPQHIQERYMRDILTITFAHPSMKGFLMWGFWDGAHWLGNAPIYNTDWTLKPSGQAFIDQVFDQWWTDEVMTTNANGSAQVRGYRGKYRITVSCPDGSTTSQDIVLDGDKSLIINTSCVVSATEPQATWNVQVTPNPAHQFFTVTWDKNALQDNVVIIITDTLGRTLNYRSTLARFGQSRYDVTNWPSGVYTLRMTYGGQQIVRKVVVE
jgi:endo-1,4-beta-xylanase